MRKYFYVSQPGFTAVGDSVTIVSVRGCPRPLVIGRQHRGHSSVGYHVLIHLRLVAARRSPARISQPCISSSPSTSFRASPAEVATTVLVGGTLLFRGLSVYMSLSSGTAGALRSRSRAVMVTSCAGLAAPDGSVRYPRHYCMYCVSRRSGGDCPEQVSQPQSRSPSSLDITLYLSWSNCLLVKLGPVVTIPATRRGVW